MYHTEQLDVNLLQMAHNTVHWFYYQHMHLIYLMSLLT